MTASINVLGISGSLRKASFNTAALRAAAELIPPGFNLETFDLAPLPMYNDDVRVAGYPAVVQEFRAKITAADALLLVTPAYTYSVPGVLKNAIDWASRPPDVPLAGKIAAIMGAATGLLGTARAQYHLRQICLGVNMLLVTRPEVFIAQSAQKFDATGKLIDQTARDLIAQLLVALKDLTLKLRG